MAFAGPIIGMPFSLEGFAFFAEAIFLGIYLYGWERVSPPAPPGERRDGGRERGALGLLRHPGQRLDEPPGRLRPAGRARHRRSIPWAPCSRPAGCTRCCTCSSPATPPPASRWPASTPSSSGATRRHAFHRAALGIALAVGGVAALLQPLSGRPLGPGPGPEPAGQARRHGGPLPDPARRAAAPRRPARRRGRASPASRWRSPGGLSLLAFHDPDAEVKGLADFPRDRWPNVLQGPPGLPGHGRAWARPWPLLALVALLLWWRSRRLPVHPRFLLALVVRRARSGSWRWRPAGWSPSGAASPSPSGG